MAEQKRSSGKPIDATKLDGIVAQARHDANKRLEGYREQSLRLHPWVCGRCGREFTRQNLHELTVHHKDHNHDNNPSDGSNWENLCLYCHDNEHQRFVEHARGHGQGSSKSSVSATFSPFAGLKEMLRDGNKDNE